MYQSVILIIIIINSSYCVCEDELVEVLQAERGESI